MMGDRTRITDVGAASLVCEFQTLRIRTRRSIFVVMSIEQTKLQAAMHGVECIVEIEHDPLRHSGAGGAIEIDERPPHA